jgi:hypothetical protein
MRMRVVGLEEIVWTEHITAGVLKVTLSAKGHKGYGDKFYLYVPMDEFGLWPYGSEVDVTVAPATAEPASELAPMEHAGESSAEEGDRD